MIKLFSKNIVFVLALLPLIILINILLENYYPTFNNSGEHLTNLWGIEFNELPLIVNKLIVVCFLTLNAVLINFSFNQHDFFERPTYLPSLIYVLLATFFPFSVSVNGELFAQTFIILSINQLFKITKQTEDIRSNVFNASFLIGVAGTFNPIYIYFLLIVFIFLIRLRPFVFREFLLGLIGIIIPFMFLWFFNQDFYTSLVFFDATLNYEKLALILLLFPNALVLLLFIFSYRFILIRFTKSSIRFKRLMNIVLLILILISSIVGLLFSIYETYYYFSVGIFVLAILLPYSYLDAKTKLFSTLLFYGLIAFTVIKFFGLPNWIW